MRDAKNIHRQMENGGENLFSQAVFSLAA